MTALEVIDRLIEAVEAGTVGWNAMASVAEESSSIGLPLSQVLASAYRGDLNAAKNLHEALLPGWDALLDLRSDVTVSNGAKNLIGYRDYFGKADGNPARSWLLAILRAHRHQIAAGGE